MPSAMIADLAAITSSIGDIGSLLHLTSNFVHPFHYSQPPLAGALADAFLHVNMLKEFLTLRERCGPALSLPVPKVLKAIVLIAESGASVDDLEREMVPSLDARMCHLSNPLYRRRASACRHLSHALQYWRLRMHARGRLTPNNSRSRCSVFEPMYHTCPGTEPLPSCLRRRWRCFPTVPMSLTGL